MSLIKDFLPFLHLDHVNTKTESLLLSLRDFTTNPSCKTSESELCRDESTALILKFVAIASILVAGFGGIAIPLIREHHRFLRSDGDVLPAAKAFAAGVILATGFVHMLNDAWEALNNPCLKSKSGVWEKFPFTGFFAMVSALLTLFVDFVGTQYYEQRRKGNIGCGVEHGKGVGDGEVEELLGESSGGGIVRIVGMRGNVVQRRDSQRGNGDVEEEEHAHSHSHSHSFGGDDDVETSTRHVVVSQVLELGIVSHSIIIGLSLGVSQSPCTMRPLIAALSFHQFFEGFALGGCISQAQFKTLSATIMACCFALTTPLGVAIGAGIASNFNPYSPGALVTEGILDSLSAGILVYMALVDLIAADFHSKRMRCNFRLQIVSFCLLFLGAVFMSLLALWA